MNQSDTPFIDGDTISWWKFDQFRIPLPHLKNLHPLTEPSKQPFCRQFAIEKESLAKLIDEGVAMLFFPPRKHVKGCCERKGGIEVDLLLFR